jgi:hypothetical protein
VTIIETAGTHAAGVHEGNGDVRTVQGDGVLISVVELGA